MLQLPFVGVLPNRQPGKGCHQNNTKPHQASNRTEQFFALGPGNGIKSPFTRGHVLRAWSLVQLSSLKVLSTCGVLRQDMALARTSAGTVYIEWTYRPACGILRGLLVLTKLACYTWRWQALDAQMLKHTRGCASLPGSQYRPHPTG